MEVVIASHDFYSRLKKKKWPPLYTDFVPVFFPLASPRSPLLCSPLPHRDRPRSTVPVSTVLVSTVPASTVPRRALASLVDRFSPVSRPSLPPPTLPSPSPAAIPASTVAASSLPSSLPPPWPPLSSSQSPQRSHAEPSLVLRRSSSVLRRSLIAFSLLTFPPDGSILMNLMTNLAVLRAMKGPRALVEFSPSCPPTASDKPRMFKTILIRDCAYALVIFSGGFSFEDYNCQQNLNVGVHQNEDYLARESNTVRGGDSETGGASSAKGARGELQQRRTNDATPAKAADARACSGGDVSRSAALRKAVADRRREAAWGWCGRGLVDAERHQRLRRRRRREERGAGGERGDGGERREEPGVTGVRSGSERRSDGRRREVRE
ncbi:hypothetical protein Scep_016318 [Stephania cephalantha]|uniref:Uncharacterized protein n=1 Tax=Stephania cephalantha TaxID=152367 RepID=A0AAP0NUI5_9MAGN